MLKEQHIVVRPKEIKEQMRNKIFDMYQSGKCSKAISKALGLQRSTVRAIIHTWIKLGTVVNLPRSGRPTKITPRAQRRLIQEVINNPQQHLKNWMPHLPQLRSVFIRVVNLHWSYGSVRLGLSCHRCITVNWRCTAFSIFNFTSHVYNFVNKYKQSDIWTEPLILPAQRKHTSWMYQTLTWFNVSPLHIMELRTADLHTACLLQVVLTGLFIKARCRLLK